MPGERHLRNLLTNLSPELVAGEFVFCSFHNSSYGEHVDLEPIASVNESEGLTLVIPRSIAEDRGLSYETVFKGITLNAHSSLEAVGLTVAFAHKLAEHGIAANVLAGYYHDHIFVPREYAEKAMKALEELARWP
jgi:hypothetical protein